MEPGIYELVALVADSFLRIGGRLSNADLEAVIVRFRIDQPAADEVMMEAVMLLAQADEPMPAPLLTPAVKVIAEFPLAGVMMEAVCAHGRDEDTLPGHEAIRRADTAGHVVRSETDWDFVFSHREELLSSLDGRWLHTACPVEDEPSEVYSLDHQNGEWFADGSNPDHEWSASDLILRFKGEDGK